MRNVSPARGMSFYGSGVSDSSAAIVRHVVAVPRLLRQWRQRARDRALLARFDSRMRRDIGLTPADVTREINRPFWRE